MLGRREAEISGRHVNVLLIEDNFADAGFIKSLLDQSLRVPYRVTHVDTLSEAMTCLNRSEYQIVLLDLSLPDSIGIASVEKLASFVTCPPILVLTGHEDFDLSVQSLRHGADDYLLKKHICVSDGDTDRAFDILERCILYAIERRARKDAEAALLTNLNLYKQALGFLFNTSDHLFSLAKKEIDSH